MRRPIWTEYRPRDQRRQAGGLGRRYLRCGASRDSPDTDYVPRFRVYTSDDVVGVELAGALKNIIAVGAGISDGMGAGDNAKAAFMTRGLAEIARLGRVLGANPLTFAGLAGLGDLVATCESPHSRNRRLGQALAEGLSLSEAQARLGQVAEGVTTVLTARELAARHGVEMPITEQLHAILFEGKELRGAIDELMQRDLKPELAGLAGMLSRDTLLDRVLGGAMFAFMAQALGQGQRAARADDAGRPASPAARPT